MVLEYNLHQYSKIQILHHNQDQLVAVDLVLLVQDLQELTGLLVEAEAVFIICPILLVKVVVLVDLMRVREMLDNQQEQTELMHFQTLVVVVEEHLMIPERVV